MKHTHDFVRYELCYPVNDWHGGLVDVVVYYVGYECRCGEQGYAVLEAA